ncbi:hypothetical protein JAK51_03080 [Stenotrophomonas maltophilia]|nr:hypothetical protein [Stenotrophomonas maltophilia]
MCANCYRQVAQLGSWKTSTPSWRSFARGP